MAAEAERFAGVVSAIGSPAALRRAPASWTLEKGRLSVLDADGRELFGHALGFPLAGSFTNRTARASDAPVRFADIDGDGVDEVLLVPPALDPANARLYCFDSAGSLRFVHQSDASVRFGETVYGGPWAVKRSFVTRRSNGERALWVVSGHHSHFPSSLRELDPDGNVRREYWSNGPIGFVAEIRWHDADVVLVGAADEDKRGASLAIFDRNEVVGSAPARRAGYDCTSCPLGGPREYLVFPRTCLAEGPTLVVDAWVDPGDRLSLWINQPRADEPNAEHLVYYSFDGSLSLVQAEIGRELQLVHNALEKRGLLDHAFGPRDDAALFPVLRFDGSRFSALPPLSVVGH